MAGPRKTRVLLSRPTKKKSPGGAPRPNGLLAVELFSGECFFQAQQEAKSEQVAAYLADLATHLQQQGYQKAYVFIDNNPTHQQKMIALFQEQSAPLTILLLFHYLPKYSPKLNLVEYLIHLIRQKWLGQPRSITAITTAIWPPSKLI